MLLISVLAGTGSFQQAEATGAGEVDLHGLHVDGNQLVNGSGQPVQIHGVNRSGSEYACIHGWGVFDGPADAASIEAIQSWNANAIRVPLNEQCWLGVNTNPAYGGANYQQAIRDYVNLITGQGMVAIVDLHWSAPSGEIADALRPMPDRDHSVTFWREVAATFADNDLVVFDLFNEPYPDGNQDTAEAWRCWRDGGTCAGIHYEVAGMQELVSTVRDAGAPNVIMLSGIQYSAGLSGWLEHRPVDPLNNTVASWHMYPISWYATDDAYWDGTVAGLMQHVPLIAGEIGQIDCGSDFLTKAMNWLDAHGGSYNAWVWTTWGNCESVIQDYSGTPTPYGQIYRDHLRGLAATTPNAGSGDVNAPALSVTPPGGSYDAPQMVTLSASSQAAIYYTTDGSEPAHDSLVYQGPIQVESSMTLRAVAIDGAGNRSAVLSEEYKIDGGSQSPRRGGKLRR